MSHESRKFSLVAILAIVIAASLLAPTDVSARNLHLVDELPNGFAIYRCGKPTADDLDRLRRLGVAEMCVLSGNADSFEERNRDRHPDLKIVYNRAQDAEVMLPDEFLDWFDEWVEEARAEGRKIAFRCNCGCHRTGRLAAYYQMKWMGLSLEDALGQMQENGMHMNRYPSLPQQVEQLQERIR